ncbi:MAG: class I tRNA ligase family protein, partial [Bacillota bacterium]
MARESYDHTQIEPAARELWKELDLYRADLTDSTKDPYYLLFEFPYPSGDLHLGHWYAFALTDIYARKLRMEGKNVLFPVGFDAFGLPAENAAIKHGLDPKKWTYENMERMRAQIDSMGASMDWSKEVITCDPSYYKWTQWLFTKFYEHGLAERRLAAVKWCPNDQTVLANEQVNDGHCERCGAEVEDKNLTQWFLLITKYADRLLKDLDPLPWREEIKDAQRAWIGESEGAKLTFPIVLAGENVDIEIFTTRPDTIFGATYLVLAPEHPEVEKLLTHATNSDAVRAYQRETGKKTERERSENKEKTGVKLEGISAINPAAKEEIPVYIADYVLASYGTGAVMAVPAHDERDFEFAKKHGLPIKQVIEPKFVSTKGDEAFRPGEEIVHREAVCAVVRNPKDDTYLCISWKGMEMRGQVTGGIEEGEDIVEAARREVLEETGYKNLKHIERPDYTINTFFYHRMKKVNRWAHFHYVFFELENDEREPLAAEEEAMHDVVWTKSSDLRSFFTVFEGDFVADLVDKTDLLYTGDGILKDSGTFDGRENREAMGEMVDAIGGEHVKQYRIRDWSVGRQRYWGCPIPIVYDPEGNPHPIPQEHLPWLLPTDVDFTPGAAGAGKSPLASSTELHERVTRIFGEGWTPEYDTLDTFVDSSWYFLRYLDPKDDHDFSDQELMKKWMPVDRYSGGSEHTTMHLLYARFFTKVLYDLALCPVAEPFAERFNRGLILGPDGQKMSKSKGNVLNPDDFVAKYGADAVRIYLAFIGPYNEPGNYPWNLDGVVSMRRFLERVYALSERMDDSDPSHEVKRSLALAVHKVGSDIDRFKYNTAVSALMVLVRELENLSQVPREAFRTLLLLLASFAPHLTEHLWKEIGEQGSIHGA